MSNLGAAMKFFGYCKGGGELVEMSEVCLQANPDQLHMLADFILKCADAIRRDPIWEHEHYSDSYDSSNEACDFVIFKSDSNVID